MASKHPILEAEFTEYKLMPKKNLFLKSINYGILSVKVDLGGTANGGNQRKVGIISNLHFPFAFELDLESANNESPVGDSRDWEKRLDFTYDTHRSFERKATSQGDLICWSSIAGDFNFSNTPGERFFKVTLIYHFVILSND